jgi:hypothetical protein
VSLYYARRGRSIASNNYFRERHPNRPYFGLTQVNRAFRKEFTPLYIAAVKPVVQIQDAGKYLETFGLPDEELSQQLANVFSSLSRMKGSTKGPGVDVLPLLKVDRTTLPFTIYNEHTGPYWIREPLDLVYKLLDDFAHLSSDLRPADAQLQIGEITAVRLSRSKDAPGTSWGSIITLELSKEVNEHADEELKAHIFTGFVHRTDHCRGGVRAECVSGLTKMVATWSYMARLAVVKVETSRPAKRKLWG